MRVPALEFDGWGLDDGESMALQHPATFQIPDLDLRQALNVGDYAKLMFRIQMEENKQVVERMWVIITRRSDDGYVGILDNELTLVERNDFLWRGAELAFKACHVIDVGHANDQSRMLAALPLGIPWINDQATAAS